MLAAALVVLLRGRTRRVHLSPRRAPGTAGPGCRSSPAPSPGRRIGLLLLNVSCPVAGRPERPARAARRLAQHGRSGRQMGARRGTPPCALGRCGCSATKVRPTDTTPTRGRSLLRPALTAAAASEPAGRRRDRRRDRGRRRHPARAARTRPRSGLRRGKPARRHRLDQRGRAVASHGGRFDRARRRGPVGRGRRGREPRGGGALGRQAGGEPATPAEPGATVRSPSVAFASAAIGPGDHVLRVRLAGTETRSREPMPGCICVTVAPTPGVVLLAAPADWDSRFLYRALRDVAQLPGAWLRAARRRPLALDERPVRVGTDRVRQAARGADLLILKGDPGSLAGGTRGRAGSGAGPAARPAPRRSPGDWYLSAAGGLTDRRCVPGPAGGFLSAGDAADPDRAAVRATGSDSPRSSAGGARLAPAVYGPTGRAGAHGLGRGRRTLALGVPRRRQRAELPHLGGFHGELAARRRRLRAGRRVAGPAGGAERPTVGLRMDRARAGGRGAGGLDRTARVPAPTPCASTAPAGPSVRLPPGEYRYRFAGGGGGTVAVEEYSDELLPAPVDPDQPNRAGPAPQGRTAARDWLWLFGIAVAALSRRMARAAAPRAALRGC